jgi:hypothetical protein
MRFLPRSAKGTWLLATAAWLACCVAAWHLLPPRPRAEWIGDFKSRWVKDVLPDGPTVVLLGGLVPQFYNAATGRVFEAEIESPAPAFVGYSPDNKWLLTYRDSLLQLHPSDGGLDITLGFAKLPYYGNLRHHWFSPDGRRLAFEAYVDGLLSLRMFDLTSLRPVGIADGIQVLYGFSEDGDRLVCRSTTDEILIVGWPSGRIQSRCPASPNCYFAMLASTGDRVVQYCSTNKVDKTLVAWDLSAGAKLFEVHHDLAAASPGSQRYVFTQDGNVWDSTSVTVWETNTGKQIARTALSHESAISSELRWASPDGRTILVNECTVADDNSTQTWLEKHVPWLGVKQETNQAILIDVISGKASRVPGNSGWPSSAPVLAADGQTVAVLDQRVLRLWDVPLRPPLTWFAVAAGVLALPIVWLGRRRVMRLRRGGA